MDIVFHWLVNFHFIMFIWTSCDKHYATMWSPNWSDSTDYFDNDLNVENDVTKQACVTHL